MHRKTWLARALVLALIPAAPALAEDAAPGIVPPSPAASPFGKDVMLVEEAVLAKTAGREDVRIVDQKIDVQNSSNVSDNIITGDFQTGMIGIDGSAFDNFNGLALFSLNTGNNVAINSSMSVNVSFQQ